MQSKDLSQVLRARLAAAEEVQARAHELECAREGVLHGRNEMLELRNAEHLLDQAALGPLRSEKKSLEATLAAQEHVS